MIKKFQDWLVVAPTKTDSAILVISFLLANLGWFLFFGYIFVILGIAPGPTLNPSAGFGAAIFSLMTASIIEEIIFRIIPLTLALMKWNIRRGTLWTLIGSSVFFGLIHGDARNILLQGVMGFMLGILFIKFNPQGKRAIFAGGIVISAHFAFNLIAYGLNFVSHL